MSDMQLSPQGAKFTTHHEGFIPRWYLDPVQIGTIGIGFTWRSDSFREWWAKNKPNMKFGPGATMTRAEAEDALAYLMKREYGAAVNKLLSGVAVPQHVFDAASSTTFNCGPGTLTDRWARALQAGDIDTAAELLKTTRTTAKGVRLKGLVNRRLDEAELLKDGDYTIGRPRLKGAVTGDPMSDGVLQRREQGKAVEALQRDLQAHGLYLDGSVDGVFGPGTEAAVMEFQRSAGLKDDGLVGPRTFAALARKGSDDAPTIAVTEVGNPTPITIPVLPNIPDPAPAETVDMPISVPASTATNPAGEALSPVEQTNKANKSALGAAAGSGGVGPGLLYLWSTSGSFPDMWAADPQAMIILTGFASAISGAIGAWLGGYWAKDKRFQV